uniref:Uncharacterized protein n=1 Tax=Candidatus Kentrum sp. LFY TaxID=2126342 RepID=A0A450UKT2_9GAMM|nr:MAG: hypothetical protein BECKLFY1418B_GA0070995_104217 [Candidatus Kentron sp. LFY]
MGNKEKVVLPPFATVTYAMRTDIGEDHTNFRSMARMVDDNVGTAIVNATPTTSEPNLLEDPKPDVVIPEFDTLTENF